MTQEMHSSLLMAMKLLKEFAFTKNASWPFTCKSNITKKCANNTLQCGDLLWSKVPWK